MYFNHMFYTCWEEPDIHQAWEQELEKHEEIVPLPSKKSCICMICTTFIDENHGETTETQEILMTDCIQLVDLENSLHTDQKEYICD